MPTSSARDTSTRRRPRPARGPREGLGQSKATDTTNSTHEVVEHACTGTFELRGEYSVVRDSGGDVSVSPATARESGLRPGDEIVGVTTTAKGTRRLVRVTSVSGMSSAQALARPKFEDLTPIFPTERLKLEGGGRSGDPTTRIIDLLAPIGKGQRAMVVSPPKAGKTMLVRQIAQAIETNHPEVRLLVLLIDERPEEVTDMRKAVAGEVLSSTFDRPAAEHIRVAEAALERAKRMVELGLDVVIILDGITRLARAYNLGGRLSGRTMSGGVDSGALYPPKKFFGAARNIEEGGSLTIIATALVETGSRMDEVIFEEFKGTGNSELRLDRRLAERRLYPAIDVAGSSTRHDELLMDATHLAAVWRLRRVLSGLGESGRDAAGLELLIEKVKSTASNDEFLAQITASGA